jgi:hypothetical protein
MSVITRFVWSALSIAAWTGHAKERVDEGERQNEGKGRPWEGLERKEGVVEGGLGGARAEEERGREGNARALSGKHQLSRNGFICMDTHACKQFVMRCFRT